MNEDFCGMYEYHDKYAGKTGKGSHKFYEIVPAYEDGSRLYGIYDYHWGRVGTKGQWRRGLSHSNAIDKSWEKRDKGYELIKHWDKYNNLVDSVIIEDVAVTFDFMEELKAL